MAVAYASSSTTSIAISSTCVLTKPSGLSVGDLMIAYVGGVLNTAADYTAPVGWTVLVGQSNGAESVRAFYKVADSSDVAASNFTFNGSGTDYIGGGIIRVTGAASIFTNYSTQISATATFNTADLTPDGANSLLLFFVFYVGGVSGGITSYACATSNPTWTEVFDFNSTAPSTDFGLALAYANRPEITSTGDFSCSDPGDEFGIFISLAPVINTTATPGVMSITTSTASPTVTGTGTASIGEIYATMSVSAPTVTTPTETWSNTQKSSSTWTNTPKS